MSTPFALDGSTALVTGAGRGIGRAVAEALAAAGADIVAASSGLDTEGGEVRRRVEEHGRRYEAHRVDFADRDAVADFARRLAGRPEPVDILVNNAGTISRAPALDVAQDDWDRILQVNLSSQFLLTQALARPMVDRGAGRIIFVASLLSFQGGINVPAYTASKSAVAGLTKALANEWTAHGVTVNAIAPGYIATDNTTALREDPERSRAILERIPAGRWGRADDIAGAAVFLASPAAAYVSGAVLPVDGGWLGR
ncbi:SDR family oxidoreductase [Streptomyces sp. NPDC050560]|uniref:SDR family oxidoreductase n=1 Tax=Streptomyces sp. NPDC050560 TaxID=3365630 RepID=UPI0037A24038